MSEITRDAVLAKWTKYSKASLLQAVTTARKIMKSVLKYADYSYSFFDV